MSLTARVLRLFAADVAPMGCTIEQRMVSSASAIARASVALNGRFSKAANDNAASSNGAEPKLRILHRHLNDAPATATTVAVAVAPAVTVAIAVAVAVAPAVTVAIAVAVAVAHNYHPSGISAITLSA